MKVYVIFQTAHNFFSIINLPFCICQTFSSFSTLHHPCSITLLLACLFLSSLTHSVVSSWFIFQWWCVYSVSTWYISRGRRAGLLLSLPCENIHCGPGSLQCFSLWVKAKTNQPSPSANCHRNSRTAGVDGYSYTWQLCWNVDHRFQRQKSDQIGILIFSLVIFHGLKFCFLFVLSLSEYSQGLTECQQSKLSCTNKGDFLSAQEHPVSGRWLCVSPQGEELSWTSSDGPVTVEECKGTCYSQR